MSINDIRGKIKPYWSKHIIPAVSTVKAGFDIKEDILIISAIILIGLAGFGLGKLSALEKGREPVEIKPAQFSALASSTVDTSLTSTPLGAKEGAVIPYQSATAMIASESAKGLLVASKTGKKYHFPWCAGAAQISDKNKIWFNSYEEAQKAGYTPASNCPNLK